MNFTEVSNRLEESGTNQNIKIYRNHGCDIELYGVSIKNLKDVHKVIKKDTKLGLELFRSRNADMLYLSQWVVDINDVTDEDINSLIDDTSYYLVLENVIPNILIKDLERSKKFIETYLHCVSPRYQQVAYSLYSQAISYYDLDMNKIDQELDYIKEHLQASHNRVKYVMNNFLISVGVYIKEFSNKVLEIDNSIGKITVDMGKTSCKVPSVSTYIRKNIDRNTLGVKKKIPKS